MSRKNNIRPTQDVRASNCCAIAYVVLSQKFWRALGYMNWIASHRRVDEGVTVGNWRIDHLRFADYLVLQAWVFSTVSSARIWSIFWCVIKQERISALKFWGIVSLKTPKAVYSARDQKYTAAGGDVKYLAVVFTSDGSRNKGIDTRISKANAVLPLCVSFIAPWRQNWCFQSPQSFQLFNRSLFRSSPVVMNLRWRLKEYWHKNRRQRWNVCEESTVWHFVTKSTVLKPWSPQCQATFPNREIPAMLVRPCISRMS